MSLARMCYPRIYFAAQVAFAYKIAQITGTPLHSALAHFTALEEELTGASIQAQAHQILWETFLASVAHTTAQEATDIVYTLYLQQPYAAYNPNWLPHGVRRFGALGVAANPYNLDRNRVKLHFLPRRAEGSDLATASIPARREDFRALLMWTKTHYPDIPSLISSTWLHNIPNYRALFPPCVLEHFVYQEHKFLGVWGQFVRWNGAAHEERYQQFLSDLGYAHTVIEAIRAIPLPVTGAVVPLQAFYTWYGIS